MGKHLQPSRIAGLVLILLCALAGSNAASAQTGITLANLDAASGTQPNAGLIADASGNLYGTASDDLGGSSFGTVFEIKKDSTSQTGYASTPTVLVSFTSYSTEGANPVAGLISDASGNLYGTAYEGGSGGSYGCGCGVVFEVKKDSTSATGYASTPITLVSFNGTDGVAPFGALVFDAAGNLYGTTNYGGAGYDPTNNDFGYGTVFEIKKDSTSQTGYASTPTTLVSFNGTDGANPEDSLIFDSVGNLYGTTFDGGTGFVASEPGSGNGTVFEIKKDATTQTGFATAPTPVVDFTGANGAGPYAGLIADAQGNLYGTTVAGGTAFDPNAIVFSGYGTVFEIAKTSTGYASTPTPLAYFNGTDGLAPYGGLIMDGNGSLYGTTAAGGAGFNLAEPNYGVGTVFKIARDSSTSTGYASTPNAIISFDGTNGGGFPVAGLIADASGNLYSTTLFGNNQNGTAFEVTGSGFIPPKQFAGTPGQADCQGKSISGLGQAYGGVAHAATALGYSSVAGLQQAVTQYCGQ